MREHHLHAMPLRLAVHRRGEALLLRQDLSAPDALLAEEIVIAVDELRLPDGGIKLAGRDLVERRIRPNLAPPGSHRPRRDKDNLVSRVIQFGNLLDEGRHLRNVQFSVRPAQHIASYFDGNSFHTLSFWKNMPQSYEFLM